MGAPQIIYLVLVAMGLVVDAGRDGKSEFVTHSFALSFIGKAIMAGLLFWGGFFGGG